MQDPIITAFLSQHQGFRYRYSWDDDWRQLDAFNAMASILNWSQERRVREHQHFKETWIEVAEREFQGDQLDHYRQLCQDVRIKPVPQTIDDCIEELRLVNVNLVDLIQYRKERAANRNPAPVRLFDSVRELMEYSRDQKKELSPETARAGMLNVLLRSG